MVGGMGGGTGEGWLSCKARWKWRTCCAGAQLSVPLLVFTGVAKVVEVSWWSV